MIETKDSYRLMKLQEKYGNYSESEIWWIALRKAEKLQSDIRKSIIGTI